MTRKDIEQMNVSEPYCFETDGEEDWYSVGLVHGLQITDEEPNSQWISIIYVYNFYGGLMKLFIVFSFYGNIIFK